jgi:uncharacterized RmlC-like cupin family protein
MILHLRDQTAVFGQMPGYGVRFDAIDAEHKPVEQAPSAAIPDPLGRNPPQALDLGVQSRGQRRHGAHNPHGRIGVQIVDDKSVHRGGLAETPTRGFPKSIHCATRAPSDATAEQNPMSHSHDHDHDHDHAHGHDHSYDAPPVDWKLNGVRVIEGDQLDTNTAQTPGMNRAAAINLARVGAQKIWAGTVNIHANAKTGAHHHGALESVIYVVKGKARMRWGEKLEFVAEAGPGDFIFVPPYVPHQEINASTDEALECVLVRSGNEAVVVNLDIEAVEKPEAVYWVDPIHKHP